MTQGRQGAKGNSDSSFASLRLCVPFPGGGNESANRKGPTPCHPLLPSLSPWRLCVHSPCGSSFGAIRDRTYEIPYSVCYIIPQEAPMTRETSRRSFLAEMAAAAAVVPAARSEERRVGKEGRSRWSP